MASLQKTFTPVRYEAEKREILEQAGKAALELPNLCKFIDFAPNTNVNIS